MSGLLSTLKVSFCCLLTHAVSDEKSPITLLVALQYIKYLFLSNCLEYLSAVISSLNMRCLFVVYFVFILLGVS